MSAWGFWANDPSAATATTAPAARTGTMLFLIGVSPLVSSESVRRSEPDPSHLSGRPKRPQGPSRPFCPVSPWREPGPPVKIPTPDGTRFRLTLLRTEPDALSELPGR